MTQHDTTMLRCVFTARSCSKAWQAQLVLLDPSLASMSLLECKRHCSHLFATCEVKQSDYHPIIIRFFSILQDSSRLFNILCSCLCARDDAGDLIAAATDAHFLYLCNGSWTARLRQTRKQRTDLGPALS